MYDFAFSLCTGINEAGPQFFRNIPEEESLKLHFVNLVQLRVVI